MTTLSLPATPCSRPGRQPRCSSSAGWPRTAGRISPAPSTTTRRRWPSIPTSRGSGTAAAGPTSSPMRSNWPWRTSSGRSGSTDPTAMRLAAGARRSPAGPASRRGHRCRGIPPPRCAGRSEVLHRGADLRARRCGCGERGPQGGSRGRGADRLLSGPRRGLDPRGGAADACRTRGIPATRSSPTRLFGRSSAG